LGARGRAFRTEPSDDLWPDAFTEDIDWKIEGVVAVSGRQAVREFFDGLAEQFAAHTITVDESIEDGDRLICFVTHRVTKHDGESGEFKAVHDWRFRDGQAVSLHEIADTLAFAIFSGQVPAPATV
jgi:ketosteroid isomerase-like protein